MNDDRASRGGSDERFAALAEGVPHLVWLADADGNIIYVNNRFAEYTGWDRERIEQPGRKFIVHDDDLENVWRAWRRALADGTPYEIEYRLRRASDNSYRWFLARAVPMRDEDGRIVQWIGTATDIDDTRRANENLRFTVAAYSALYTLDSVDEICRRLVNIAVEHVCDWALVVLLNDDDRTYRVAALAHKDAAILHEVERYADVYPPRPGGPLDRVVRSGEGLVVPSIDPEALRAAAQSDEHRDLLERLKMHSIVIAPIIGETGTRYGAISTFSSSSGRSYGNDDLRVLDSIARRAGKSIDHALLLEHERRSADQIRFLSEVSEVLFSSFQVRTMLENFVHAIVPARADAAVVLRTEDPNALRVAAVYGMGPQARDLSETFTGTRPFRAEIEARAIERLAARQAFVTNAIESHAIRERVWEYVAPSLEHLQLASAVTIPLIVRGTLFGAAILYRYVGNARYREADLPLYDDLGRRLSIAIAQAETVERERRISSELQRAMLPDPGMLPRIDGMEFSVVYRPSLREAEVGGDWYDAFPLPDGSLVIGVGDVSGRGLRAAGLMGKLRQALGVVPLYEQDPARVLDAVDALLRLRGSQAMATAFLGIISPDRKRIRFANAGHPYPILRQNGKLVYLTTDGMPLGLRDQAAGFSRELSLEGADLLALYTDGLIESTHDIVEGEARLADAVLSDAIMHVRSVADFIASTCLDRTYQDDAAVLAIAFRQAKRWSFDAENAKAAQGARSQFVHYLTAQGAVGDFSASEIIFGELIGNVVRHAPGPIEVQVEWVGDTPRLHVTDRGGGFSTTFEAPDVMREGGRGLFIVDTLGKQVSVEYVPRYGTHVSVDLPLTRKISET